MAINKAKDWLLTSPLPVQVLWSLQKNNIILIDLIDSETLLKGIQYSNTLFIQIAKRCQQPRILIYCCYYTTLCVYFYLSLSLSILSHSSERTPDTDHTSAPAASSLLSLTLRSNWLMQSPRELWVNFWTHTSQRERAWDIWSEKPPETEAQQTHSNRLFSGCSSLACGHLHPTMGGHENPI